MNPLQLFRRTDETDHFGAGETVFKEGEPGHTMYVVKSGEVDISLDGKQVASVSSGGLVGEMTLIDASARSATATARTDCELVPVDEHRFGFLVQQTPFFALHVMRVLVERLRDTNRLLKAS